VRNEPQHIEVPGVGSSHTLRRSGHVAPFVVFPHGSEKVPSAKHLEKGLQVEAVQPTLQTNGGHF
jgi:ribosomal protein L25 (general stress protein Ctc)